MRFRKLSQRGKIIYVISALLFSLLIGGIGFVWWAAQTAAALPEALAALQSDGVVEVAVTPWLTFTPVERTPTVGFILYPAARVDPRAYAPAAQAPAPKQPIGPGACHPRGKLGCAFGVFDARCLALAPKRV